MYRLCPSLIALQTERSSQPRFVPTRKLPSGNNHHSIPIEDQLPQVKYFRGCTNSLQTNPWPLSFLDCKSFPTDFHIVCNDILSNKSYFIHIMYISILSATSSEKFLILKKIERYFLKVCIAQNVN
jgi:hypothetical protein